MGEDNVQAEEESLEDNAEVRPLSPGASNEDEELTWASLQVHPRQPRNDSKSGMFGLWEDYDRCFTWGNLGHCGKVEVDYTARRKGVEAGAKANEFPHDVQEQ